MANGILAVKNLSYSGGAALSGGSWTNLTFILDPAINTKAVSTDATNASTQFTLDFVNTTYARTFNLLYTNLGVYSSVRVQTSFDSGFSTIDNDSGPVEVFSGVYSSDILEWEDENWWTGKPLDSEIDLFDRHFTFVAPENWSFRYVRFLIDDTANPQGNVSISRIFVAPVWQFEYNMEYPFERGFESQTLSDRSFGGTQWFDPRTPVSYVRFSLAFMGIDEAMSRALEFIRRADVYNEVLFVYDPDDISYSLRRNIFGYLRQLNPVEQYQYGLNRITFEIEKKL